MRESSSRMLANQGFVKGEVRNGEKKGGGQSVVYLKRVVEVLKRQDEMGTMEWQMRL